MKKNTQLKFQINSDNQKSLSEELYLRYGKKLYVYGIRNWHLNEDDSWEMVYKTLHQVIQSHQRYRFENENKFSAFVFKIFINYLRNQYRDHQKLSEQFRLIRLDDENILEHPQEQVYEEPLSLKMEVLNEALDEMEDWQRILLLMRSEGRPYSEIAAFVDKPEEQLKVYYQRLKIALSKTINERIQ